MEIRKFVMIAMTRNAGVIGMPYRCAKVSSMLVKIAISAGLNSTWPSEMPNSESFLSMPNFLVASRTFVPKAAAEEAVVSAMVSVGSVFLKSRMGETFFMAAMRRRLAR